MVWSIEKELQSSAPQSSLAEAMVALHLLAHPNESFEIEVARDWYQSGGETFSFVFDVKRYDGSQRYILKACAGLGMGPPVEVVEMWLHRRRELSRRGVLTPYLHGSWRGMILEEFIPFRISSVMGNDSLPNLAWNTGTTLRRVLTAGFDPIGIHDWRTRDKDVPVVIDFGSDLGGRASRPYLPTRPQVEALLGTAGMSRQERAIGWRGFLTNSDDVRGSDYDVDDSN